MRFVWLGVAVVGFYPFTLVANGQITTGSLVMSFAVLQQFIRVCLLLVAVLYLSGANNHAVRPAAQNLKPTHFGFLSESAENVNRGAVC